MVAEIYVCELCGEGFEDTKEIDLTDYVPGDGAFKYDERVGRKEYESVIKTYEYVHGKRCRPDHWCGCDFRFWDALSADKTRKDDVAELVEAKMQLICIKKEMDELKDGIKKLQLENDEFMAKIERRHTIPINEPFLCTIPINEPFLCTRVLN